MNVTLMCYNFLYNLRKEKTLSFFTYMQNNPGGSFIQDHRSAAYVIIEADSLEEANLIAVKKAGIYFDGVSDGKDCDCCGDRWSFPYSDEGDANPSIYGESISQYISEKKQYVDKGINFVIIYRKNGVTEVV